MMTPKELKEYFETQKRIYKELKDYTYERWLEQYCIELITEVKRADTLRSELKKFIGCK